MTKKNFFLVTILLISTSPLLAQFGAHAGASFSTYKEKFDGSEEFDIENSLKTGFTAGIFYRKQIGGILALQPEINWMQKGGKQSLSDGEFSVERDVILNYIEVPIYLMYTGGNSSGFFAGVGPAFNFAMSGKSKESFDDEEVEYDFNFGSGENDDLKGFHMAINGIAGYQLDNGINFNAFVSQSITNTALDDDYSSQVDLFSFGLRVGYVFGGGEEARSAKVRIKQVL